jgi:hypothetical protein
LSAGTAERSVRARGDAPEIIAPEKMSPLNITVKNDCRLPVMVRETIEKEYKGEPIAIGFNRQYLLDFSHRGRALEGPRSRG